MAAESSFQRVHGEFKGTPVHAHLINSRIRGNASANCRGSSGIASDTAGLFASPIEDENKQAQPRLPATQLPLPRMADTPSPRIYTSEVELCCCRCLAFFDRKAHHLLSLVDMHKLNWGLNVDTPQFWAMLMGTDRYRGRPYSLRVPCKMANITEHTNEKVGARCDGFNNMCGDYARQGC